MNKKALTLATSLLVLTILVTPVMAGSATKVAVTAECESSISGYEYWVVDHGILQFRGGDGSGVVTLYIPGQKPLVGTCSAVIDGKIKLNKPTPPWPDAEVLARGKMIWSFEGGTFEGVSHAKRIGFPAAFESYIDSHCVLQGTGVFEGQTLMLSYEGPPPRVWEGFLLTR